MSPVRPTVQLIGTRLDPDAHRVRDFLTRIAQPHELIEADRRRPRRCSPPVERPACRRRR